jgi:hypothetical protein
MKELDILILFVFVLSCIFTVNQIFKVVTNIFSDEPKQIIYSWTEKVSNYFFISYLITYLIIKFI